MGKSHARNPTPTSRNRGRVVRKAGARCRDNKLIKGKRPIRRSGERDAGMGNAGNGKNRETREEEDVLQRTQFAIRRLGYINTLYSLLEHAGSLPRICTPSPVAVMTVTPRHRQKRRGWGSCSRSSSRSAVVVVVVDDDVV